MRTWFGHHLRSARSAWARSWLAPANSLLSILAIGIALALPAGGYVLLGSARQLAANAATGPQISVFMKLATDRDGTRKTQAVLEQHPGVRVSAFLPRESTLARMRENPGLRDVIDVLGGNPFPDAFVIAATDESTQSMERLAEEFRRLPGVEHVQLDSAWVRRLEAGLKLGRTLVLVLGGLLACGLVAISFSVVRMQLLTHQAEVEVSRLLGATDTYIRRPYLYQGAFLGMGGGLVALALVTLAMLLLRGPATELAGLYDLRLVLSVPGRVDAAALLGAATGLGWMGALFSLNRSLATP